MTKTAWVFPGQGSQAVGMGADLLELPATIAKFNQAHEILGWSVNEICQSEENLARTLYTQPCLYVVESILVDEIQACGHQADLVAGHSLGEYVALYAAGVFDFATGLKLVKRRAELMDNASDGLMAAIMGFDRNQLDQQIQQTPGVVLANDNNAGQVVISGTSEAVETVMKSVKSKRAVKLNVSGAFHSPLMKDAAIEFQQVLDDAAFATAQVPVLSNVDPTPATDAEVLKQRLSQQMTGSVRWREISLQLAALGMERAIEIGPGKVLTGLIKRTSPDLALVNISVLSDIPA
ncbi:MAG: ACP S-malonyltransferase [Leptolyngbyaceae cyanobacterium bins.302]|nr:ACP S-malonyltransferase [Leptolyngbyaceae cyanobacterium bins.302]